jgi:hypothetical protein
MGHEVAGPSGVAVSVVIPTFNRGEKLGETLDHLLRSDTTGLGRIEVIVVDDGSDLPAEPVVTARRPPPPFSLRCVRQPNAGPASARNTGYRCSTGNLILFVDDDILVPPVLIRQHKEAHYLNPSAVVCGVYPISPQGPSTFLQRLVNELWSDPGLVGTGEFVEVTVVSSGQLSLERATLQGDTFVYRDDLRTPAAEEYELSARLTRRGVRLLLATRIVAAHARETQIAAVCRQQYRNGMGCAEAAMKYPETLGLAELSSVLISNGPPRRGEAPGLTIRKVLKTPFATRAGRSAMLGLARLAERVRSPERVLRSAYLAAIAANFVGGVRDGLARYEANTSPPS